MQDYTFYCDDPEARRLSAAYASRGVWSGGHLLLPQQAARAFIDDAQAAGLVVLGMDFWKQFDTGRGEMGINSVDCSSMLGRPDVVEQAAAFARQVISGGLPDGAQWVAFTLHRRA